jgi:hypothetical protein
MTDYIRFYMRYELRPKTGITGTFRMFRATSSNLLTNAKGPDGSNKYPDSLIEQFLCHSKKTITRKRFAAHDLTEPVNWLREQYGF